MGLQEMVLCRYSRHDCEVRTGRTPDPSDVAEERMRLCRAQWGHDLYGGRRLEKPGPKR